MRHALGRNVDGCWTRSNWGARAQRAPKLILHKRVTVCRAGDRETREGWQSACIGQRRACQGDGPGWRRALEEPLSESVKQREAPRPKSHSFNFIGTDEALGAEHWHCPTCGRQILLWWPPNYKRKVLVAGDEEIPHMAAKGGLRMAPVRAAKATGELPN